VDFLARKYSRPASGHRFCTEFSGILARKSVHLTPNHMKMRLLSIACSFALLVGLAGSPFVFAADAAARFFDIPAGDAESTLREFVKQSGVQLIYDSQKLSGVRTSGLRGRYMPRTALDSMLAGTRFVAAQDRETGALTVQGESARPNPPRAAQTESDRPQAIPLADPAQADTDQKDDFITLSPFEVKEDNRGYYASNTMSGTRLNSSIEDLGSSITVVTKEQMSDFAMLDINDIFLYEASSEGMGTYTEFSIDRNGSPEDSSSLNPNGANRVRGMGPANISFGNFETSGRVPIDPINVDAVEISRGPNSSVFGIGNTAGAVNMLPASANVQRNRTTISFRADSYGGYRSSIDINRVLKPKVLAIRVSAVDQHDAFKRKPSGIDTTRLNAMLRFQPFKYTTITASHSYYKMKGTRVNNVMPRDGVSGWRNAGSPTWDPVTSTAKINGVPVPGNWTATSLPSYFSNGQFRTMSTLFINPDGTVGFWSPSRTTSTTNPNTGNQNVVLVNSVPDPIRQTQPLFSGDPTVSGRDVYDYTSINLAAMNSYDQLANTSRVNLEQTFLNTPRQLLAMQADWYREESRSISTELAGRAGGGGATGMLYVDVNERMIDGSPNPYFLQPFFGYFRIAWDRDLPFERDISRLQLAYRLDLHKEKSLLRWLGMHQISAYGEQKVTRRRETLYQDQVVDSHAWYQLPSALTESAALPAVPAVLTQYERFYVGDATGQNVETAPSKLVYGTYPFTWGNGVSKVFIKEPARLGKSFSRTNGWDKDTITTQGAVIQSHLLKDRVVTTFGLRKDRTSQQNPAGRLYTFGPDGVGVVGDTLHTLNPDKDYNEGTTRTSGLVVKPLSWVNLHYNKSNSFQPADLIYLDLHLNQIPNPTGEGEDYGFSVKLFNGKFIARVNRFVTTQYNSRDGSTRTLAQRVRRIDFPTPANLSGGLTFQARDWITAAAAAQGMTLTEEQIVQRISEISKLDPIYFTREESPAQENNNIFAVADVQSKGLEIELNYNPNRFWTTKFNASKIEALDLRISQDTLNWINERLPVWESIIDPQIGRPWFTERYDGVQSYKEFLQTSVLQPLNIAIANEGKSRPQVRRYRFNLSTSYKLAGITDHRWFRAMTVGGALRWEDKGAIGYYGVQELPEIITDLDPNRPIYDKARAYADLFVAYRTRLFRDKIGTTFQLNVRNIQENGRLQAVSAYPDGTPNAYRIIDPRQFILTVTFDL